MKILNKYIIKNILKTAFIAILIFALILAAVELFGRMDSIITGSIPFSSVLEYALLSIPQYFMMVASLAFLFSTTYFLSMLSSNNERIALLNSGIGKAKLALPIIILALILTVLGIGLKETLINPLIAEHERMGQELFGLSGSNDTRNLVLRDDNGYMIYARRYISSSNRILDPVIVKSGENGITERIEGDEGIWNDGYWTIKNAKRFSINEDDIVITEVDSLELKDLKIKPEFFLSENLTIETMSFSYAITYLSKLKQSNPIAWQEKATDWYRALFSPIGIFVLMTVAATMSYSMKKNVLLFSIIQALCVAIVYYVSDMVFSIAAHQGTIHPLLSVLLPLIVTVVINFILDIIGKKI